MVLSQSVDFALVGVTVKADETRAGTPLTFRLTGPGKDVPGTIVTSKDTAPPVRSRFPSPTTDRANAPLGTGAPLAMVVVGAGPVTAMAIGAVLVIEPAVATSRRLYVAGIIVADVAMRSSVAPAVGFGDMVATAPSGRPRTRKVTRGETVVRGATSTRNTAVAPAVRLIPGFGTTMSKSALGPTDTGVASVVEGVRVVVGAGGAVTVVGGNVATMAGRVIDVASTTASVAATSIVVALRVAPRVAPRVVVVRRLVAALRFVVFAEVRRIEATVFVAVDVFPAVVVVVDFTATVGAAAGGFELGTTTVAAGAITGAEAASTEATTAT